MLNLNTERNKLYDKKNYTAGFCYEKKIKIDHRGDN